MNPLVKMRTWGAAHPGWLTILRVTLGLLLIWKGISFMINLDSLTVLLKQTGLDDSIGLAAFINLFAQLIIILHLLGGACIALNVKTRFFCLLNLPVLFGAVFVINYQQEAFRPHMEFWMSLIVLLAIVFVLLTTVSENAEQPHPLSHLKGEA
jgi:putative oxidoreductase